eukprot:353150-Chlamydomonas_euryale.AAC.2
MRPPDPTPTSTRRRDGASDGPRMIRQAASAPSAFAAAAAAAAAGAAGARARPASGRKTRLPGLCDVYLSPNLPGAAAVASDLIASRLSARLWRGAGAAARGE